MKKIILLSAFVISTLVSCSTEDAPVYNKNSSKTSLNNNDLTNFYMTLRDTTSRETDSLVESVNPKPIKP
ncbi:hypothetical protein [Flavobacterium terrigena]|uniref:Lipoprotein n=1 Tax=Flavobacterium terrigena TaxID=402734 RepID=A0A1H6VAP9_9FLAO|nr:hypothetical protein [Flavobacterium terrigena]SEJ00896.1 hypothetical protein SAMN05660918_2136 [Flavobacterium terrigena]